MAGFIIGPQVEALSFLEGVTLPFDLVLLGLLFFTLGYFMNGSILAAIGVISGSQQQSQQYARLSHCRAYLIPLFLSHLVYREPNGTVSSSLCHLCRLLRRFDDLDPGGFSAVPLWQIGLSAVFMFAATVFAIWASARIFRWGLLLYGKKISVRDLLTVIRSRQPIDSGDYVPQKLGKEA